MKQNDALHIHETISSERKIVMKSLSILLVLLVLVFFVMMMKAYLDGDFKSVESLQEYISQFGKAGPLILTLIQIAQVILPVLPGFLGCIVGAVLYGPATGFLCNYIGISVGSIAAFFLARKYGTPLVKELFPAEKYEKWSQRAARSKSYSSFLFAATLLPLFPDDFLCYFSGVTEISAKRFIWIIIIGKPWCILAYSLGFSLI